MQGGILFGCFGEVLCCANPKLYLLAASSVDSACVWRGTGGTGSRTDGVALGRHFSAGETGCMEPAPKTWRPSASAACPPAGPHTSTYARQPRAAACAGTCCGSSGSARWSGRGNRGRPVLGSLSKGRPAREDVATKREKGKSPFQSRMLDEGISSPLTPLPTPSPCTCHPCSMVLLPPPHMHKSHPCGPRHSGITEHTEKEEKKSTKGASCPNTPSPRFLAPHLTTAGPSDQGYLQVREVTLFYSVGGKDKWQRETKYFF